MRSADIPRLGHKIRPIVKVQSEYQKEKGDDATPRARPLGSWICRFPPQL